jgi:transposase InsO family protein
MTEAFPWDEAPNHLIRDRDACYGGAFRRRLAAIGIRDHPIAPRSPWQNGACAEADWLDPSRMPGSRHLIFGEAHLRQVLKAYAAYYNQVRTHLALTKDSPLSRPVHRFGYVVAKPIVGGLRHEYCQI